MKNAPDMIYPFLRNLEQMKKDRIITPDEAVEEYRKLHESNRKEAEWRGQENKRFVDFYKNQFKKFLKK